MQKVISFCVPCYNSAEYMEKCINLLAKAGNDVEVLVVDDGSKDDTLKIAKALEKKYPGIVKAIHQENKGHGGAVMTGIKNASGKYYKVIDSDDWANTEDVLSVVKTIKSTKDEVDLYVVNYIYERIYENSSIVVDYKKYLPTNKVFGWSEMKKFPDNKVFMMHSLIYRTELLRNCGLNIPEHTFYVDNYFCYQPLPHCKKIFYINNDFYHYFLGRPGQSCTDDNLYKNYAMQIKVCDVVFGSYSYNEIVKMNKNLRDYLFHAARAMYLIMLIFNAGGKQNIKQRKQDYKDIRLKLKERDIKLYRKAVSFFPITLLRARPWCIRRSFARFSMKIRSKLSL